MDRDRELLDSIGPRRLAAEEIRELLMQRGWMIENLALWLGLTRVHLGRIIRDVHRARHWDLAFLSLPRLADRDANILTQLRVARRREQANSKLAALPALVANADPAPAKRTGPGYRYCGILVTGAVVVVIASHAGDIAEEGEEGVVVAVRDSGDREDYLIRFLSGEDWFDPDSFDACMAETGKEV
ncbi:hypothetical protein [Gulbenkiania mobilis]|uniref:hypothetical protein n=1 Tax=Gulbenkiania mobilis TaxID=397457 RepID=UPI0006BBDBF0|nr:hypothetical protein [Gulbenkiania mobilis]